MLRREPTRLEVKEDLEEELDEYKQMLVQRQAAGRPGGGNEGRADQSTDDFLQQLQPSPPPHHHHRVAAATRTSTTARIPHAT
ncbi:Aste57867_4345 [Aphanomyces stellatus]|uniref:Aste57867_4345 protein n=1 Tax=Aphanomyces stellatus TaxID=120398 RepID=A0A485KCL9_9STRA|nr:hypothetical protein As57867_004333 [Aphanomyces stellatus]VFT81459.1 Aste57867_4345 [Aphanomyces stellatus]